MKKSKYSHPKNHLNLNQTYFRTINTKEKAYWLGLLFADGCILNPKNAKCCYFTQLHLDELDKDLIFKFAKAVKADTNKIRRIYDKKQKTVSWDLNITSTMFSKFLIDKGCTPRKSKIIRFPSCLRNNKFKLAFLLGYYDGDGSQNTPRITCGSKKFLYDLKYVFGINNKVCIYPNKRGYYLNFGIDNFIKMIKNYKYSLPRKRNVLYDKPISFYLSKSYVPYNKSI